MDDLFNNKLFENATAFESGYIAGFAQFEVSKIRFHLAPLTGGREFCPSDHREAHFGKKAVAMEKQMIQMIKKKTGFAHCPKKF